MHQGGFKGQALCEEKVAEMCLFSFRFLTGSQGTFGFALSETWTHMCICLSPPELMGQWETEPRNINIQNMLEFDLLAEYVS